MSESCHADVFLPGTASFSWPMAVAASLRQHLPEATVDDGPLFGQQPAPGLVPLQATFGDGYVLSFYPRLGAGTEALALLAEYAAPGACAGPMAALRGTPGGLIIEVSGANDMRGPGPGGDHQQEFLRACQASLGPDGSVMLDYAESSPHLGQSATLLPG